MNLSETRFFLWNFIFSLDFIWNSIFYTYFLFENRSCMKKIIEHHHFSHPLITKSWFFMESMKDGSASCIFIKNLHVFMCRLWNLNELLDFFCKLKCYLLISNKELWFHIQGNGPSCDQPDNRSFSYKQKGLWQCQPPHFWFPVCFI